MLLKNPAFRPSPRRGARLKNCFVFLATLTLTACAVFSPPPTITPPPPPTATPVTPDPQGTATTFLEAWQAGDYAGMYSFLSPLSQAAISREDFQARYADFARTATLTAFETRILSSRNLGLTAQVLYEVTYHTAIVGDISPRQATMPLIYADGHWQISWTDAMILPELAEGNLVRMEVAIPARANIYDRNGLGLAVQGEAVAIGVQPGEITDEPALLTTLSALLKLRPETLQSKYAAARPDWYVPLGEASAEDVQANFEALVSLSGVKLSRYTSRYYPYSGVAPQVVGYLSNITPEELSTYQAQGYQGDERVGRAGLEAWGEKYLAGQRGGKLYVVSPNGQVVGGLAESQPLPAQAIYTTLDRSLQLAAREALGSFKGAVVVLNPETGEVLALVSNPEFDPNLFEPTNRNSASPETILEDPGRPLLNRATQGLYPPGSVFKISMMAAGILNGGYQHDTTFNCTGLWSKLGPTALKYDWTVALGVPPHGSVNLVEALAFSCDPYFYDLAYNLYQADPDFAPKVARQFGLGQPTGFELDEAAGLIPDQAWKQTTYGERWTAGDSVNMGIGQGYVLVTPLQIAKIMAAIRNGGTLYQPHVVARVVPPDGNPVYEAKPTAQGKLPLNAEQLALLKEGLEGVTGIPHGTARHIFLGLETPVAGKTGTAEDPAGGAPHAWFAGYTEGHNPNKPDIAMVVVVENQGEGSEFAAPIFRRIVEIYFTGRPYTLYPWETEFTVPVPVTVTPSP